MSEIRPLPPAVLRLQRPALLVGGIALALSLLGILISGPERFFLGYVFGFVVWTGLTLGCLAVLMLQHVTGGAWGLVIRRPLESAARMTWIMGLLSVPVLLGIRYLYVWVEQPTDQSEFQAWYLRPGFWIFRTVLYFAIWISIATSLVRWSEQQDDTADPRLAKRMENLSAIGLVIYGLTITLAVVDWVMSMSPAWISTIYGFVFMASQTLFAFSAMVIVLVMLYSTEEMRPLVRRSHFHELGNLMLAMLMFWAYVAFSQFLLIWAGNIADETPFYVYRTHGGLQYVAILLIAAGFFLPFLCLLSGKLKRSLRAITIIAGWIILTRMLDLFWIVVPSWSQGHGLPPSTLFHFHYQDLLPLIGIGGLWVGLYVWQLGRSPLLPPNDPRIPEVAHAHD